LEVVTEVRREEALLKAGALQNAILKQRELLQHRHGRAGRDSNLQCRRERMLGYAASEVLNRITPAEISDPQEVIARAEALSIELGTKITRALRRWCSSLARD